MSLPCSAITVVVVDDDVSFRSGLAAILEEDGHVVGQYRDARDVPPAALLAAEVVVIDLYQMVASDGLAFVDRVHAVRPEAAIVLATAYWTVEIEAEVAARDFLQLCRKPIDYDELHTFLHRLAARD